MGGHKAPAAGASEAPTAAATPAAAGLTLTQTQVEALLKSAIDKVTHDTDAKVGPLRQELADARRRVADLETAPTIHHHHEQEPDMADRTTTTHDDHGNNDTTVVRHVDHVHRWAPGESDDCPAPSPRNRRTVVTDEPQMVLVPKREWSWPKALAIVGCGGAFMLVLGYAVMSRSSPSISAKTPEVELVVKGMQEAPIAPAAAPLTKQDIADAIKAAQPATPPPTPAPTPAAPTTSNLPRCTPECITRCSAANANKGIDAALVSSICVQTDCAPGVGCQ